MCAMNLSPGSRSTKEYMFSRVNLPHIHENPFTTIRRCSYQVMLDVRGESGAMKLLKSLWLVRFQD
jgi:hypothetical protein